MIKHSQQLLRETGFYHAGFFILAILICVKAGTGPFNVPWGDSSSFIYIAKLMQNGHVPYLDVFDHKGLVLYVINYIGLCLNGNTGIWVYEIISLYISIFYCFKTALIITNNKMVSFISILCSFTVLNHYFGSGNFVEEYSLPFIAISLYIFTKHLLKNEYSIKASNLIILGFSFGVVIMLRPDMISIWIVYCTTIVIKLLLKKRYKLFINYSVYFLIGFLVVIIPCLQYLKVNNALTAFLAQYFEFNFKYSSSGGIKEWLNAIIIFSSTNIFTISILVFALLIANIKRYNLFFVFSGFAYLLLTFLIITLSGNVFSHYGIVLIPSFIIPLSYFFEYIRANYLVKYNVVVQVIVLLLIISILTNTQLITFRNIYIKSSHENIINASSSRCTLVNFIKSNTAVNDSIIVFGNNSSVYLESNRYSASKYFYQYPIGVIDKNIASEFIEDIKNFTPIIIVDYKNNMDRIDMMAIFLKEYTNLNYDKHRIGVYDVYLRKS